MFHTEDLFWKDSPISLSTGQVPTETQSITSSLKQFKPLNRQAIAFSWDLATLKYPLEKNGKKADVNSTEFEYLGNSFHLYIQRNINGYVGCYLVRTEEEPNFFGSFYYEFDLVLKSDGKRVPGFVKYELRRSTKYFKKGSGRGYINFFPGDDISRPTLSQYQVLIRIKPNEKLSTFSNNDHSLDIFDQFFSRINYKETSIVSFEVDGYIFQSLKNVLLSDYFKTLLDGFFTEGTQSKSGIPISIQEVKPETFYEILRWLHTGDIQMIWKPTSLFELYRTANYFQIQDLCNVIIKFITATFDEYNFGQVYEFANEIANDYLAQAVLSKWKESWKENRVKLKRPFRW